jgi:hypothetical protein
MDRGHRWTAAEVLTSQWISLYPDSVSNCGVALKG